MENSKSNSQEYNQMTKASESSRAEIKKALSRAALSVCINLFLASGKGAAGIIGGSSALIADAIHSAADVIASAATCFGLWLAGKEHPSYPYGLYKAETLATLFTSVVVIIAGYEIARSALLGSETIPNITIVFPVAVISLMITIIFSLIQLRVGKRLHSLALEADARDYMADGLSTSVVVIGFIGIYFGLQLDRWAAGIVAIFIFWSGGQLLWRALRDLMDAAIDRDTEREIIKLVESHARVDHVEKCLSRKVGSRFMVDLDVVIRSHSLELGHRISHLLENEISRRFPLVVMARVSIHCHQSDKLCRLTPVIAPRGAIEVHLAKAPWFCVETLERDTKKIFSREYVQNPYRKSKTKRGFLVGKWLLTFKPDQVFVAKEKEGTASALLKEAGVEVILVEDSGVGKMCREA
jgi:cation diffusion facilitator family transporter